MTEKITMAAVWEELDEAERKVLAHMVNIEEGQMALHKVSNILKAVLYRYHDFDTQLARAKHLEQLQRQEQPKQQMALQKQMADYQQAARGPYQAQTASNSSVWPFKTTR